MKKLAIILSMFIAVLFTANSAEAQRNENVGALLSGLINVNVQNIDVEVIDDVEVTDVIDVSNVLNNNQVDILRNAIQNNPIASNNQNVLNNLLQGANIITGNQIVVGVLSGLPVILTLP